MKETVLKRLHLSCSTQQTKIEVIPALQIVEETKRLRTLPKVTHLINIARTQPCGLLQTLYHQPQVTPLPQVFRLLVSYKMHSNAVCLVQLAFYTTPSGKKHS